MMRQQRAPRMDIWIGEDFQKSLSQVLYKFPIQTIQHSRTCIQRLREDHPNAARVVTVSLVTTGIYYFLAPAIMVLGLKAAGFTGSGVTAGSAAAGLQSAVYGGTTTTGLFSACQSIGATGVVGSGPLATISGIGSLAAGASILGSSSRKTKTGDDSGSKSEASDLAGGNRSISPPPHS